MKTKKKLFKIVIPILAVLIVVGVGLAWYFTSHKDVKVSAPPTEVPTATSEATIDSGSDGATANSTLPPSATDGATTPGKVKVKGLDGEYDPDNLDPNILEFDTKTGMPIFKPGVKEWTWYYDKQLDAELWAYPPTSSPHDYCNKFTIDDLDGATLEVEYEDGATYKYEEIPHHNIFLTEEMKSIKITAKGKLVAWNGDRPIGAIMGGDYTCVTSDAAPGYPKGSNNNAS